MHLIAFSLEGYRRFSSKTSVKLHGDLIALVGPNEAGKSSLLRAIAQLHKDGPIEKKDRTRRSDQEPTLTWHFQLEADDRVSISEIEGASHIERVAISRSSQDGQRHWSLQPESPQRDRKNRRRAETFLRELREDPRFKGFSTDQQSPFTLDLYDQVAKRLKTDPENYTEDEINSFRRLANTLHSTKYLENEIEIQEKDTKKRMTTYNSRIGRLANLLTSLADDEQKDSPFKRIVNTLASRLPEIEFFSEADRNLLSEYDLTEVAANPPPALYHLSSLADLDLRALLREVEEKAIADVTTRKNIANNRLSKAFQQKWNQHGIAIQFEVQGRILHIQATTPEDSGLSDIADRSDGMRWFAALLAFSNGWSNGPILLVDEIERHLHYDAQADLIDVLSTQRFTSKVIYSTHSFGCLPNDLGTGVRVVHPIEGGKSKLENGFWGKGAGFSPLLASMGAAAMSFTPTRHAIIAEGPSDAILLPTLLRQATGSEKLGFQVAPGLSSVAAISVSQLELEAVRVGFIVDGDSGGKAVAAKLVGAGISADRIVILSDSGGEALEIEDLVDMDVYIDAVNEEIRCWNTAAAECDSNALTPTMRTKSLESWCRENSIGTPDKTVVAQRIVDMAGSGKQIYSSKNERDIMRLLTSFNLILGLIKT